MIHTFKGWTPIPHHYAYFASFDWLEKKFYISINSMSINLRTIFLPPAPEMCKYDFDDKVGIVRNELSFLWILPDV